MSTAFPTEPTDVGADSEADAGDGSAATATPPRPRIDLRFLLSHPAHFIALGAGSGLSPVAPGTAGTLWAWGAFALLSRWLDTAAWGWTLLIGLPLGWWACTATARRARSDDPGFIVWDEVLAFWLVLWVLMPATPVMQLIAFVLFRYFDAAKPGPVRWADRRFKGGGWRGGFGILFDDLIAAGCTLFVIAAAITFARLLHGQLAG